MSILIITNHVSDYRYHQFQALSEKTGVYVYCLQRRQPKHRNWRKHIDTRYKIVSLFKMLRLSLSVTQILLLENGKQTIALNVVLLILTAFTRKKITLWYGLSSVPDNTLKVYVFRAYYLIYLLRVKNILFYSHLAKDTFERISRKSIAVPYKISGQQYPFYEEYGREPASSLSLPSLKEIEKLNILYLGQDIHRKGIDFLVSELEALQNLVNFKIQLSLCGGNFDRFFRNNFIEIERLQYADVVRKVELFGEADLVIVPSRHDPWPHVVSEALGFGKLPLISKCCGNSHVVADLCVEPMFDTTFTVDKKSSLVDTLMGLFRHQRSTFVMLDVSKRNKLFSMEEFCEDILKLK